MNNGAEFHKIQTDTQDVGKSRFLVDLKKKRLALITPFFAPSLINLQATRMHTGRLLLKWLLVRKARSTAV
jgi:hypothetical protein